MCDRQHRESLDYCNLLPVSGWPVELRTPALSFQTGGFGLFRIFLVGFHGRLLMDERQTI